MELTHVAETKGKLSAVDPVWTEQGNARILVIEDDEDTRHALRILFESSGYEILSIGDGQNAFAMIQKTKPSAILLDLGLPGLDGFEVLERIRKAQPALLARTIVLSAWDTTQNKARALEAGARFYLQKPIPFADLRSCIEAVMLAAD